MNYLRYLFSIILLSLFACTKVDKIAIVKIGDISFRRSYANHENMTKMQNDSIELLNPELINSSNLQLNSNLEKLGIVKNKRLELNNLKWNFSQITSKDLDSNFKFCRVYYDDKKACQVLEVKVNKGNLSFDLANENPVQFYSVDILKGGYKEIVVKEDYYIMNGDNYDLQIFQIK